MIAFLLSPFGRAAIEISLALLLVVGAWLYAEHRGAALATAQCQVRVGAINAANATATIRALQEARAQDDADAEKVKNALDSYYAQKAADDADLAALRRKVASAPKSNHKLSPRIRAAITGGVN